MHWSAFSVAVAAFACSGPEPGDGQDVWGGTDAADVSDAANVGDAESLDTSGSDSGAADTAASDACVGPDCGGEESDGTDTAEFPRYPLDEVLRLNHVQAKGTHNSYHVFPPEGVYLPELEYEMPPLDVQLGEHGIRQFELDIHFDPAVGLQVYHAPVIDPNTTCATLVECLSIAKFWSDAHPGHHAIFFFVEPKDDVDPYPLDDKYDLMDQEILTVWPAERVLRPDDVRGTRPTLRDAVLEDGWPTLGQTRNKAVFVMLDTDKHREGYTLEHPNLEGRVMFVTAEGDDSYAAILKIDDPIADYALIQDRVAEGFIVRTRSDTLPGSEEWGRKQSALDSGAHLVSTNYPGPVEGFEYVLELPGGTPSRCNPLVAPELCTSEAVENL